MKRSVALSSLSALAALPSETREYRIYKAALEKMDAAPSVRALEDCIGEVEDALENLHLALSERGRMA
ncbi:MAG TPA: hypothetical protein VMC79_03355 [Rectinemataceae bacterium]|nr:hypothetical protein [Rectinemataceae bacterium]